MPLTTEQYHALHHFIADRIADLGPAGMGDPFVAAVNAQLTVHGDLLTYQDFDGQADAGFIDGVGLALQHVAARWPAHPDYQSAWAPPRTDGLGLLEGDYR